MLRIGSTPPESSQTSPDAAGRAQRRACIDAQGFGRATNQRTGGAARAVPAPATEAATPASMTQKRVGRKPELPFLTKVYNAFAPLFGWPLVQSWDADSSIKTVFTTERVQKTLTRINSGEVLNEIVPEDFRRDYPRSMFRIGGEATLQGDYNMQIFSLIQQALPPQRTGELRRDEAYLHLLRYQIQDLANQQLFGMHDSLHPAMIMNYANRGYSLQDRASSPDHNADIAVEEQQKGAWKAALKRLGVPASAYATGTFSPGLEFSITREDNILKITGIKKYVVHDQNQNPIGFDALRVDIALDLTKWDATKLLNDQRPEYVLQLPSVN